MKEELPKRRVPVRPRICAGRNLLAGTKVVLRLESRGDIKRPGQTGGKQMADKDRTAYLERQLELEKGKLYVLSTSWYEVTEECVRYRTMLETIRDHMFADTLDELDGDALIAVLEEKADE